MKESSLSKNVREALKRGGFRSCRVENPCQPGFPDIAYQTPEGLIGLCELKQRDAPKRASTKIDLGLRPAQRAFIATWGAGAVYTLAKVGTRCLLLRDGRVNYPLDQLLSEAIWVGKTKIELMTEFPAVLHEQSLRLYADAARGYAQRT